MAGQAGTGTGTGRSRRPRTQPKRRPTRFGKLRHKFMLAGLGVWKVTLGVATFKTVEVAIHNPELSTIAVALCAALATAAPGVLLLWSAEE